MTLLYANDANIVMQMSVKMIDIARKLSVSIATVSRSMKDDQSISLATRERVHAVAAEMGYPQQASRGSSKARGVKQVRHVGLVINDTPQSRSDPRHVFSRMISGMSDFARLESLALNVNYVGAQALDSLHLPGHMPIGLEEGVLSGLILVGHFPKPVVAELSNRLPAVQMVTADTDDAIDCVDHDADAGIVQHVEELVRLGHRQIGFFGVGAARKFSRVRFAAYVEALAANDIQYDPAAVRQYPGDVPAPQSALIAEVKRAIETGVTAWVCANDSLGYWLMGELMAAGLEVPREVSLVGVDDMPPPRGLPKLTTFDPPFEDMGRVALRLLRERLDDPHRIPVRVMLRCRPVSGLSIAAPSKAVCRD